MARTKTTARQSTRNTGISAKKSSTPNILNDTPPNSVILNRSRKTEKTGIKTHTDSGRQTDFSCKSVDNRGSNYKRSPVFKNLPHTSSKKSKSQKKQRNRPGDVALREIR